MPGPDGPGGCGEGSGRGRPWPRVSVQSITQVDGIAPSRWSDRLHAWISRIRSVCHSVPSFAAGMVRMSSTADSRISQSRSIVAWRSVVVPAVMVVIVASLVSSVVRAIPVRQPNTNVVQTGYQLGPVNILQI